MPAPQPPPLPPDVSLQRLYDAPLTDALGSLRGPAWAVVRRGQRLGVVHLGRTHERLETIPGKPPGLAWMVNPETTQYEDRSHAAWGLLRNQQANSNDDNDSNDDSKRHDRTCGPRNDDSKRNEKKREVEDEVDDEIATQHAATANTTTTRHRHNVNDRLPRPFSASQIKKYVECPRKWGWQYLDGHKPKSTAAAELGKEVHAILEKWLQYGTPPDPHTKPGKIAAAMVKQLPTPGKHLEVERKFQFELRGHHYRGFVDLGYWKQRDSGVWVVHDHKTTGDLMWALTEEELIHDIQAILYAKEAMDRHDVDEVELSWLYARTRSSPKPTPRVTKIHRDDVESGIEVIETYTNEMAEIRAQKLPVLELEPNVMACGNFGGCDFVGKCQLTGRQKRQAVFAQEKKKMSLKEKMQARRTNRKGGSAERSRPVAVPDEPEEVEETEEAEAEEEEEEEKPKKKKGSKGSKKKGGVFGKKKSKKKERTEEEKAPKKKKKKTSSAKKKSSAKAKEPEINPPESPDEEEQTKPLSKEEEEAKKEAEKGGKKKSKAGRPKGSKNKTSDITDREAFVQIFSAAVGSANRHAFDMAAEAWALFQKEFGDG